MFVGVGAFADPNSEESMSISEASGSTSTLATHSPVSDGTESDTLPPFGQDQIFDPLRYPVQNGNVVRPESEKALEQESARSVILMSNKSPDTISTSEHSSQSMIVSHLTACSKNYNLSNVLVQKSYEMVGSPTPADTRVLHPHEAGMPLPSTSSHQSTTVTTVTSATDNPSTADVARRGRVLNLSELEYSLPATEVYEPETVDFPSSPTTFRTLNISASFSEVVRLADGEGELVKSQEEQDDDDDKSVYTATANPPTGKVILRKVERPKSLMAQRKRLTVTEELLTVCVDDDQQSVTSLSYQNSEDDDDDDAQMLSHDEFTDMLTPDDIDTPDELEECIMERLGPEPSIEPPPESSSAATDTRDEKSWRAVVLSGIERRIDMKVIEPYKKVLSHGGYMPSGSSEAIIVFSACFLPDRSRRDYDYVMDHLFMYVLTTLDQLIAEDYVLVYLHGATTRGNMPSFAWLKRCYQMIDRRLRKNLQGLYLVHPTFWVKTVVVMARPFVSYPDGRINRKLCFLCTTLMKLLTRIRYHTAGCVASSTVHVLQNTKEQVFCNTCTVEEATNLQYGIVFGSKFARKLRFISGLNELANVIPLDQVCIPARVKQYDDIRESLLQKKE